MENHGRLGKSHIDYADMRDIDAPMWTTERGSADPAFFVPGSWCTSLNGHRCQLSLTLTNPDPSIDPDRVAGAYGDVWVREVRAGTWVGEIDLANENTPVAKFNDTINLSTGESYRAIAVAPIGSNSAVDLTYWKRDPQNDYNDTAYGSADDLATEVRPWKKRFVELETDQTSGDTFVVATHTRTGPTSWQRNPDGSGNIAQERVVGLLGALYKRPETLAYDEMTLLESSGATQIIVHDFPRNGVFNVVTTDISSDVLLDSEGGYYVPFSGTSGSTGGFVRNTDGPFRARYFGAKPGLGVDNTIALQAAVNYLSHTEHRTLHCGVGIYESGPVRVYYDAVDNPGHSATRGGVISIKGSGAVDVKGLKRIDGLEIVGTIFQTASPDGLFKTSPNGTGLNERDVHFYDFTVRNDGTGFAIDCPSLPELVIRNVQISVGNAQGSGIKARNTWNTILDNVKVFTASGVTQTAPISEGSSCGLFIGNNQSGGGRVNFSNTSLHGLYNNVRDLSTDTLAVTYAFNSCAFQNSVGDSIIIAGNLSLSFINSHWEVNKGRCLYMTNSSSQLHIGPNCYIHGGSTTEANTYLPCIELLGVNVYNIDGVKLINPWQEFLKTTLASGVNMLGTVSNLNVGATNYANLPAGPLYLINPTNALDMPELKNINISSSHVDKMQTYNSELYSANETKGSVVQQQSSSYGKVPKLIKGAGTVNWHAGAAGLPAYTGRFDLDLTATSTLGLPLASSMQDGRKFQFSVSAVNNTHYLSVKRGATELAQITDGQVVEVIANKNDDLWEIFLLGTRII